MKGRKISLGEEEEGWAFLLYRFIFSGDMERHHSTYAKINWQRKQKGKLFGVLISGDMCDN